MEKVLTAEEMKVCDLEAIEGGRVTGVSLMDKASLGVAKVASKMLGEVRGKRIATLCGTGNNGGDGFGASFYLAQMGATLKVYVLGSTSDITGDPKVFFDKLRQLSDQHAKIEILEFERESGSLDLNDCDLVIDAILGTGLTGEPRGSAQKAIELARNAFTPVLSVDIPSGLSANNGSSYAASVRAAATATMSNLKRGLLMNDGKQNAGEIFLINIGLPDDTPGAKKVDTYMINCDDVRNLLPRRKAETHKHAVGKVFGLVGSVGLTGAGVMVGQAAMRGGAGAVILGVPSSLNPIFETKLTEVMTVPLPETRDGTLSLAVLLDIQKYFDWADVLVIGPGISKNQETAQLVHKVLRSHDGTIIIDADALNAIADQPEMLKDSQGEIILTPHHGEFSRLTKFSESEISRDRVEMARRFARENNVTLVLKGSPTVIASKDGRTFINVHGNPGMATAGTGDVLTGIIAALVSQKLSPVDAAIAGVYLHSVAGDIALESKGLYPMIATDLIEDLPAAFRKIDRGEIVEFEKIA